MTEQQNSGLEQAESQNSNMEDATTMDSDKNENIDKKLEDNDNNNNNNNNNNNEKNQKSAEDIEKDIMKKISILMKEREKKCLQIICEIIDKEVDIIIIIIII